LQRLSYAEILARVQVRSDLALKSTSVERVTHALAELGLQPPHREHVILVAGTNGKGSTAKTLETLIAGAGSSVGLFTSPHMISATERIRSHGRDLSEDEFVEAYYRIESVLEKYRLARFETFTVMMAEVFWGGRVRAPVDWAVIEVGVGGLDDPTRALSHATTVVTSIGFDHEALLGPTLSDITRNKLGVIEHGNLVIHVPFSDEAKSVIAEVRERVQGRWIEVRPFPSRVVQNPNGEPQWIVDSSWGEARLSLLGDRAVENSSLALTTLDALGFDVRELLPALATVSWPCRMERLEWQGKVFYLSGDHNPQGVESLRAILEYFVYEHIYLVVGIGANKDAAKILNALEKIARARISLTATPFRSSNTETLHNLAEEFRIQNVYTNPIDALAAALKSASERDLVVVTGSLYLVGYIRGEILKLHVAD
jgi:dihydrofolate synthase/folylpolyglutamate synthase